MDPASTIPRPQENAPRRAPSASDEPFDPVLYEEHPRFFTGAPGRVAWFVVLSFLLIGIFLLVRRWLWCATTTLTITRTRVRYDTGVLGRYHAELRLSDVRIVRVERSLLQRLFGVAGDIGVGSAGTARLEVVALGVPEPRRAAYLIEAGRDETPNTGASAASQSAQTEHPDRVDAPPNK